MAQTEDISRHKINCPKHGIQGWIGFDNNDGGHDHFCIACLNIAFKEAGAVSCPIGDLLSPEKVLETVKPFMDKVPNPDEVPSDEN